MLSPCSNSTKKPLLNTHPVFPATLGRMAPTPNYPQLAARIDIVLYGTQRVDRDNTAAAERQILITSTPDEPIRIGMRARVHASLGKMPAFFQGDIIGITDFEKEWVYLRLRADMGWTEEMIDLLTPYHRVDLPTHLDDTYRKRFPLLRDNLRLRYPIHPPMTLPAGHNHKSPLVREMAGGTLQALQATGGNPRV